MSYADSLWFMGRYNPITASTTAVTTIVTNYSNNKIYSLYNSSCSYYKYSYNQRLLLLPRSGELRTQKLKSHLVRTQSSFKAWSKSVYSYTCYAYCQGFRSCLFLHFRSIHLHFFQNLSRFFPVLAVANTWFLCRPAE